jgi:hypothetical protein
VNDTLESDDSKQPASDRSTRDETEDDDSEKALGVFNRRRTQLMGQGVGELSSRDGVLGRCIIGGWLGRVEWIARGDDGWLRVVLERRSGCRSRCWRCFGCFGGHVLTCRAPFVSLPAPEECEGWDGVYGTGRWMSGRAGCADTRMGLG